MLVYSNRSHPTSPPPPPTERRPPDRLPPDGRIGAAERAVGKESTILFLSPRAGRAADQSRTPVLAPVAVEVRSERTRRARVRAVIRCLPAASRRPSDGNDARSWCHGVGGRRHLACRSLTAMRIAHAPRRRRRSPRR